jgi:hypothetical protein
MYLKLFWFLLKTTKIKVNFHTVDIPIGVILDPPAADGVTKVTASLAVFIAAFLVFIAGPSVAFV